MKSEPDETTFHQTLFTECFTQDYPRFQLANILEIAVFVMREAKQIPPTLKKFFWDADFTKLTFPEHENYVLGRLMTYGDLASINWILRSFDHSKVSRYFATKGKCVLDRKSYLFWEKVLRMEDLWEWS